MPRENYDAKIADLQARKAATEAHDRAKLAAVNALAAVRSKAYAQALTNARALVAALEAMGGKVEGDDANHPR